MASKGDWEDAIRERVGKRNSFGDYAQHGVDSQSKTQHEIETYSLKDKMKAELLKSFLPVALAQLLLLVIFEILSNVDAGGVIWPRFWFGGEFVCVAMIVLEREQTLRWACLSITNVIMFILILKSA